LYKWEIKIGCVFVEVMMMVEVVRRGGKMRWMCRVLWWVVRLVVFCT